MNRRNFLDLMSASAILALPGCAGRAVTDVSVGSEVMTVLGPIKSTEMGISLTHEHLLASFQPYEEWAKQPLAYDRDEVVAVDLPYLQRIREMGCRTFVDATAVGLGRDPVLLQRLARESGLHILTTTGNYAAFDAQFLRAYVLTDSVEELAARWVNEWNHGIEGTDVRPGFIKLGFNGKPLTPTEQKLIRAAAVAHLQTGMTIGAHTGPAVAAFEQLAILEDSGVSPSAWIWIHAQNEKDLSRHVEAARRGAWISFDGVAPDSIDAHVAMVQNLREARALHRALVSQDAGWYSVGEPHGGKFRTFETVFTEFIPALRAHGFTQDEIHTIFVKNPANAFSIGVRARKDWKAAVRSISKPSLAPWTPHSPAPSPLA
jgi:phosphotriesterase-related protein